MKFRDNGSEIDKLKVADDLLADSITGVAAVFHWYEQSLHTTGIEFIDKRSVGCCDGIAKKSKGIGEYSYWVAE